MALILAMIVTGLLIVGNELWAKHHKTHSEFSRKFIHITVGTFVAFWPFWLTWTQIELLSLAFVVVVSLSKKFKIFQAIHTVQRPTYGEVFFGLSVGAVALITHNKWIYAAALLQMSLADGLAAIIGVKYGRPNRYTILKHHKSLAGSATFFVCSFLVLLVYGVLGDLEISLAVIAGISLIATAIENVAIAGLDNLLVPIVVAILLRLA